MHPLLKWGVNYALRRLVKQQHFTAIPTGGFRWNSASPNTKIDYEASFGDGLGSSVLMSPVRFVQRTLPEAPLTLATEKDDELLWDHELVRFYKRPNPHYTLDALLGAVIYSLIVNGNGYWLKIRGNATRRQLPWHENVTGPVTELWYAPHWSLAPKWPAEGTGFITHYEYGWGRGKVEVPPENVVHFRHQLDPRNPRLGMAMVGSEMREIFMDDEASNYSATMLRNLGVLGMVISPKSLPDGSAEIVDVDAVKAYVNQHFTGDGRGDAMVFGAPTDVHEYGTDPKKMELGGIRNVSEARVCAAIGIPPSVIHFTSGMETTRVGATMTSDLGQAWTGCIVPLQNSLARTLDLQLLPDWEPAPDDFYHQFYRDEIAALQEDQNSKATRVAQLVTAGIMRVDHAQAELGIDPDPTQNVYLRGIQVIPETAGGPKARRRLTRKQTKALKHDPTPAEREAIALAPRGRASRRQRDLIRALARQVVELEVEFDEELRAFFSKMGGEFEDAALRVLLPKSQSLAWTKGVCIVCKLDRLHWSDPGICEDCGNAGHRKAAAAEDVDAMVRLMGFNPLEVELAEIAGAHYLRVAKSAYRAIGNTLGLALDIPDDRQRQILAAGGKQMGLIDLRKQTRDRLFRELTEGREAGEGVDALVRRVREFVPAGPWSTPKVRARVIARTESLNASRTSSILAYRDSGVVQRVMIFDARLGPTDEVCESLDGKIVSLEEADALMADEHPNGSRAAVPHFG